MQCHRHRGALLPLVAIMTVFLSGAVLANSLYSVRPMSAVVAGSLFETQFDEAAFSVATTINQRGNMFGYQLTHTGQYRTFNITEGTNPRLTVVDTQDFLGLAAREPRCFWFFCTTVQPFGIARLPEGASTGFVGQTIDESPLPGSLPENRFPGNFVQSNGAGMVATTQYDGQQHFGAIVVNDAVVLPTGVSWLVAINDNNAPQVLGYRGSHADCLVFGQNCPLPVDDDCPEEDELYKNPRQNQQTGHVPAGRAAGFYQCSARAGVAPLPSQRNNDHRQAGPPNSEPGAQGQGRRARSGTTAPVTVQDNGVVLLQMAADNTYDLLGFSAMLDDGTPMEMAFPLAMNASVAVIRADLITPTGRTPGRLLTCHFDPLALDTDGDGLVDCAGGWQPLDAPSVRTVLGFSLNAQGVLAGNLGHNSAGIGQPLVLDITGAAAPALLVSRVPQPGGWELSSIVALNNSGRAVGYGYRDCSAAPEALVLSPIGSSLPGELAFMPGHWLLDTQVDAGQGFSIAPAASGGSGQYLFRYSRKQPQELVWTPLGGWSADPLQQVADSQGHLCYRIEVTDAVDMSVTREVVVRYQVGAVSANPATPSLPAEVTLQALP